MRQLFFDAVFTQFAKCPPTVMPGESLMSTELPALPPRLYHGGHLDLDVPSVVGQSTTE